MLSTWGGSNTVDYLIGPLSLVPRIDDFTILPPPLGADHSYLAFSLSGIISAMQRALPTLPQIRVHFDHTLDSVVHEASPPGT